MAPMEPIVATLLLAFMLLIALCLTLWMALTLRERTIVEPEPEAPAPERRREVYASNDEVRGARAPRKEAPVDPGLALAPRASDLGSTTVREAPRDRPARRGESGEDPFERFLRDRSKRDDLDF